MENKNSGWVNVYSTNNVNKRCDARCGGIYKTEEMAKEFISDRDSYLCTIFVEFYYSSDTGGG